MSDCTITAAEFARLKLKSEDKTAPTNWLTSRRRVRAAVWAKTGGLCWYCGNATNPFRDFSIDHFVAVANDGPDALDNYVPCCRTCNARKGSAPIEELREKLAAKNRPRFNAEQRAYLSGLEVKLPSFERYEFAFERMGWSP